MITDYETLDALRRLRESTEALILRVDKLQESQNKLAEAMDRLTGRIPAKTVPFWGPG